MSLLNIKIDNFEGPFDLLLHLIKKNEMDIYDIKIQEITNQYIEFLRAIKDMDLEITSEFIVMAATLLEIKSRLLLPMENKDEEAETVGDPREVLATKLIEYNKFKKASYYLLLKKQNNGLVFSKKPEIIEEKKGNIENIDLFKNISILDLYNLYNELIAKYNNKLNKESVIQKEIPIDKYKIEDKMLYLKSKFDTFNRLKFNELMHECDSKIEIIVTFLALLELIKERYITAIQENNFSKIYIERTIDNDTLETV